ncbi:hypothetical protein [Campylobacter sp. 19-13652]|uniref:hypothetical protein n=1 Tax=Campylobacter sp. 19-13652 TaxID=2840180 RepID=UPI001C74A3C5|nr:hypothetical protein [Campylobacter sp. 19-13652]BCX79332.1 hypothetical protein LBC_07940 [Campylobacter sp. 19-13652]
MLNDLLNDDGFALLMKMHIYEVIEFLLRDGTPFEVAAYPSFISYDPELPEHIKLHLSSERLTLFALAGYTFESAVLTGDTLRFEAGFGKADFPSTVSMPLSAIAQILVEKHPILVNFSVYKQPKNQEKEPNDDESSFSVFKNNPLNSGFFND